MAYAYIESSDPENLVDDSSSTEFQQALIQPGEEGLDSIAAPHVLREVVTALRAEQFLLKMRGETESGESIGSEVIDRAIGRLYRDRLTPVARRFGERLAQAYEQSRAFCQTPTYESPENPGAPTLANYGVVEDQIREIIERSRRVHSRVEALTRESALSAATAAGTLAESLLVAEMDIPDIRRQLDETRGRFYNDSGVRLALRTRSHVENARALHSGAHVIEGPMVTGLLNEIHRKVYGRRPTDAMGVAFGGPPGWGKTAIVTHYCKEAIGVEPISIDVDEGQSAFTLMARPRLAEADPVGATLQNLNQLKEMNGKQLKAIAEKGGEEFRQRLSIEEGDLDNEQTLREKLSAGLNALVVEQMTGVLETSERRGAYEYGPIFLALEKNVPIIINEVQNLRQADFLHSLALAIPATDEEAGSMPSYTPSEGDDSVQPRGWFFSTLTGRWMRVPHRFRVFFTGNIGDAFGNSGIPPALESRLGDRFQEMPKLPPAEQIDVAWARASDENGVLQLNSEDAAKLYHLITHVLPEIDRMHKKHGGMGMGRSYISIRTINDIARALNPQGVPVALREPKTFEQAVFEAIIQPAIANKKTQSINFALGALTASGLIGEWSMARIRESAPEIQVDQISAIGGDVKGGKGVRKGLEFNLNRLSRGKYENECVVCGAGSCPAHSEAINEELDESAFQASVLQTGLDQRAVRRIVGRLRTLTEHEQWDHVLHAQVGGLAEATKLNRILEAPQRTALAAFIEERMGQILGEADSTPTPQNCLDALMFLSRAKQSGLAEAYLSEQEERITAYLQRAADHYFDSYRQEEEHEQPSEESPANGEDGEPQVQVLPPSDSPELKKTKADPLTDNQEQLLRAIDHAAELGYEVDLSPFQTQLGASLRQTIGRYRLSINRSRGGTLKLQDLASHVALMGAAHRRFKGDESMQGYLRNQCDNDHLQRMFTLLSGLAGGAAEVTTTAFSLTAIPYRTRKKKGAKRAVKASPVPAKAAELGTALDTRLTLIEAIETWNGIASEFATQGQDEGTGSALAEIGVITGTLKNWLIENKDELIEGGHSIDYLKLIGRVARVQGEELETLLDRIIAPKTFDAPPMREF